MDKPWEQEAGDATGGLIPYKNPPALIAYYLGIVGLVPLIGVPVAVYAIFLGRKGLRLRRERPVISGAAHAWIGIVLGSISLGYHALVLLIVIVASLN